MKFKILEKEVSESQKGGRSQCRKKWKRDPSALKWFCIALSTYGKSAECTKWTIQSETDKKLVTVKSGVSLKEKRRLKTTKYYYNTVPHESVTIDRHISNKGYFSS